MFYHYDLTIYDAAGELICGAWSGPIVFRVREEDDSLYIEDVMEYEVDSEVTKEYR